MCITVISVFNKTDNTLHFNDLIETFDYFSDKQKCVSFLIQIRWGDTVKCAFCKHTRVYHLNGKNKRYKCAKCHKQFSVIKGTIFENSPIPLQRWFVAIYLMLSSKKGVSSPQLSRYLHVTQKTAWFMMHRIRYILRQKLMREKLKGLIQIDETFVGGKNKNRRWNKKVKYSQGRSFKDKTPVLGLMDEEGNIRTKVVANTKATTLQPIIRKIVEPNSIIVTDEWKAYNGLSDKYQHMIVDHKRSQYVNECGFTTNGIEGAWSHLKRMIIGVYHKVTRKHLQKYCDEFTFRYNTRKLADKGRFVLAMCKTESRLTYKRLTTIPL